MLLDMGFNVNDLLYIGGFRKTILHFCIYYELWSIANLIFDKNPNLYIYDKNGVSPYRLLKEAQLRVPPHVFSKFRALVRAQKHNHLIWNF